MNRGMAIERVVLAGKGRLGSVAVRELIKAGFQTTVLTRSSANVSKVPTGIELIEVDYDSETSLENALKGQDAVVSTVAMSAITNQTKMIDAAIKAGVKFFIPAEYSMSTRDPKAQWLPMYATVLQIQHYLESRQSSIDWAVINCGALVEFAFDYPFILDFDNRVATNYDGGDQGISLATCKIAAEAIVGVLKQPSRVKNHRVQVHGGSLTQNEALQIAKKYSKDDWTIHDRDAEIEIRNAMKQIQGGAEGMELLNALMTTTSAATFGKGHFDAVYREPDNDWLGVSTFDPGFIEEVIRKRIEIGPYSVQSSTSTAENLSDVAGDFQAK